jgi:YVTN family beta-propeller protein
VNDRRHCAKQLRLLAWLPLLLAVGSTPAEAQTKAYVAHTAANLVTVIDTATDTVTGTVSVGAGPTKVAVARDGTRAYVINRDSADVSVIDTTADSVVATIPVGGTPAGLAVTSDGGSLYVTTALGTVQVIDTAARTVVATIPVGSSGGDIAITPDGSRAYVASGLVYVIDTATNSVVRSFAAETAPVPGVGSHATSVVTSPDGSRAYVAVFSLGNGPFGFTASGSIVLVDTASESVSGEFVVGSVLGSLALTPDGSRLYIGISSTFVNTGYGAGFLPGTHVVTFDTITNTMAAAILISNGGGGTQLNTPVSLVVTPDRRAVYAAVPRMTAVVVLDVNTNAMSAVIPVTAGPGGMAGPHTADSLVPYVMDAADDISTMTTAGGLAVTNVLANDRIGGIKATPAHVTLTQLSSTSAGLLLNPASGAITLTGGALAGSETLVYEICEIADPSNCDNAIVTVTVVPPYVINAQNDNGGVTFPGRTVVGNVLANDTLGGTPATTARVTLSTVSSTAAGLTLNPATGAVFVALGTTAGTHTLTYRICEIVDPVHCDEADVTVAVNPFVIDAVNDNGLVPMAGGTAVANVLANDKFAAAVATLVKVTLSQLSSTHAGVGLNLATGAVTVAAGTTVGPHTLAYRICERAMPANCDDAIVTVTVLATPILAASESARVSSKRAGTAIANVLANDRLGTAPATLANVTLRFVSLTPANSKIRLDLTDGSVDVLGRTDSGLYLLVYEICEIAMPANCARATVRLDLTGSF